MTPWIVLGAGYTGARLVARLAAAGHAVTATRRAPFEAASLLAAAIPAAADRSESPDSSDGRGPGSDLDAAARVRTAVADLGDRATLEALPFAGAVVAVLAPPGDDPAGEMRSLVRAARDAAHLVYVSSTGVYGNAYGGWVDEKWPLAPLTAAGRARVACEAALAAAPVAILRVAGIHGPGRGLHDRLRAGTYRIVGDGSAHVSRVHVDDLVSAIVLAASLTGVYNVADDAPDPIGDVADTLAAELGVPPPPRVAPDTVPTEVAGMLTANRRIANAKLVAAGWTLAHPSWRT